jgi:hypothetical protein
VRDWVSKRIYFISSSVIKNSDWTQQEHSEKPMLPLMRESAVISARIHPHQQHGLTYLNQIVQHLQQKRATSDKDPEMQNTDLLLEIE